jgi:Winged helix DNA-binding domain
MGAVQAQEYGPAKWGLALRSQPGTTEAAIERALNQGRILRTHVLRPTWHFVTREDIRWMLELSAPQVHRRMAPYDRQLGLDADVKIRATRIIERALGESRCLTRQELGARLVRARLPGTTMHLAHLAMYAELEGVICSGPRRGKQFTYALLADRSPAAPRLSRDEALAELARRYFTSHGPATVRDFAWWSGLKAAEARRGLEMNPAKSQEVDGVKYWAIGRSPTNSKTRTTVHLLPGFDEYLVAYRDRHAVPHSLYANPSFRLAAGALVIGGQVAGAWRTIPGDKRLLVEVETPRQLTGGERRALARAAARYGRFLGVPVSVSLT